MGDTTNSTDGFGIDQLFGGFDPTSLIDSIDGTAPQVSATNGGAVPSSNGNGPSLTPQQGQAIVGGIVDIVEDGLHGLGIGPGSAATQAAAAAAAKAKAQQQLLIVGGIVVALGVLAWHFGIFDKAK